MSYSDGIMLDEILAHIKSEKEGLEADIEAMQHDTMTEGAREYLRGIISQRRRGIVTLERITKKGLA